MLKFRLLNIDDQDLFNEKLRGQSYENSEYSFANSYLWHVGYNIEIAFFDDTIFLRGRLEGDDFYKYSQPIVPIDKSVRYAIKLIEENCEKENTKFFMETCNEEFAARLKKEDYKGLLIEEDRDMFDYIYLAKDLAELSGKRYHKKRTHINKFKREIDFSYQDLTEQHLEECLTVFDKWIGNAEDIYDERMAIKLALENLDRLNLCGIMMYIDDEPAAFTIGEHFRDNMALIHLEKAVFEYRNAYQALNQDFVKGHWCDKVIYINREEDMGVPGLRHAKESYYPCRFVKKYTITYSK